MQEAQDDFGLLAQDVTKNKQKLMHILDLAKATDSQPITKYRICADKKVPKRISAKMASKPAQDFSASECLSTEQFVDALIQKSILNAQKKAVIQQKMNTCFQEIKDELIKNLEILKQKIINLINFCDLPSFFLENALGGLLQDPIKIEEQIDLLCEYFGDQEHAFFLDFSEDLKIYFDSIACKCSTILNETENYFRNLIMEKKIASGLWGEIKQYSHPKCAKLIGQFVINQGKSIPSTNGIDIHPVKNTLISMGCFGGDLVVRNMETNREINRIQLQNNLSGCFQNCLWSPFGTKIMVTTNLEPSIYIFCGPEQETLKSIKISNSAGGRGAVWLSESEVALGFDDGIIRFFCVDDEKEVGAIQLDGADVWGMDLLKASELLAGDKSGSIYNIDWKKCERIWLKQNWHCGNCQFLKLNENKKLLATGSSDYVVRIMKIEDRSKLWEFKLTHSVQGIAWVPGELYILALSYSNQLVALNSKNGNKMMQFNGLSYNSMSMRLHNKTQEIFVGDGQGVIRRLKILQD